MLINMKEYLTAIIDETGLDNGGLQLPDVTLDTNQIRCVMINEVPPKNPEDGFYSGNADADYMKTTLPLFHGAGIEANDIGDILRMGIYITTAVKAPKTGYDVPTDTIAAHLPLLEKELDIFPHLQVIMLMGDVAKKAFNKIAKSRTKKAVIPAGSTYKIRRESFFYGDIRVFPSYIMTGGNILIEKSKCVMITDDIRRMAAILKEQG